MKNYRAIAERYLPRNAVVTEHGNVQLCEVPAENLIETCNALYHRHQLPLKTIAAFDEREVTGKFRLLYLFGVSTENCFLAISLQVTEGFPSLTPTIHEASGYERKIKSFFGLDPLGHPDPRSLILHEDWPENVFPFRKDFAWNTRPETASGEFHFREMSGEGIYEIPVGPVHAGIIEPGHFRFSVAGEEILMLEPRLGYSHKGSEKLFEVLPLADKVKLAERISGDSSFSHALAFCLALESLSDSTVSQRDSYRRVIFAELERLANHFGDIGAIMTDTGFNFGGANGGRLREIILRLNERLTGSRFLRGVAEIGGVKVELDPTAAEELVKALVAVRVDFEEVMAVADNSSTLLNRLKSTGLLDEQVARDHGVIGVAGRAVGFKSDARKDFPYAAYPQVNFEIATESGGDVYARFRVRVKEVFSSIEILQQALKNLPPFVEKTAQPAPPFRKNSFAVGMVEGWRGDIVYLIATDARGEISRVEVRDPSFLNWTVLGHAGRGNVVPDFPLINKSFNLSYSGNDL
jgi:Ni,Fe-hydrogenase III large subunit/Ni,Fe-hydrogenase III component G